MNELSIQTEKFCIRNEEFYIENDDEFDRWASPSSGPGLGTWSTNSSAYTYYLLAFHSVNPKLANLGDGVQTAVTDLELLFSIVAELVAMLVFGVLAGMLSSWISAGKVSEQLYRQRMDSLAEFLRAKRFPYEVRKRVRT